MLANERATSPWLLGLALGLVHNPTQTSERSFPEVLRREVVSAQVAKLVGYRLERGLPRTPVSPKETALGAGAEQGLVEVLSVLLIT